MCTCECLSMQSWVHRTGQGRFQGAVHDMSVGHIQELLRERELHELSGELKLVDGEHESEQLRVQRRKHGSERGAVRFV